MSSKVDPNEFLEAGTRRIRAFASSAGTPLVAGAGWDGHVYVWDVRTRTRVCDFPTLAESGGVSLTLSANGSSCFVGTYYSWGAACVDLEEGRERWRRTDLKRFHGMAALPDETGVVVCFDDSAGLTLEARTGQTVERHIGLRALGASRFDRWTLKYGRRFELNGPAGERHRWNRESFALYTRCLTRQC